MPYMGHVVRKSNYLHLKQLILIIWFIYFFYLSSSYLSVRPSVQMACPPTVHVLNNVLNIHTHIYILMYASLLVKYTML